MGYLLNLAKLAAAAPDSRPETARAEPAELLPTEAEIRALLAHQCPEDHPDYPEALRIALADPGAALAALREPAETWSAEKRAELRRMAQEWREGLR